MLTRALVSSGGPAHPPWHRCQPSGSDLLDETYPPPPPPDPAGPAPDSRAADDAPGGLREGIAGVRAAAERLIRAHLELVKTEIGEIAGEIGRLVGLLVASMGCLFVLGVFLPIGLFLFLGDWLFGSLGWGVLHGSLLLVALAIQLASLAIGIPGRRIGRDLALATLLGILAGLALGLDLTNRGWTEVAARLLPDGDPVTRPLIVAVIAIAIVGGVSGFIVGWPRGGGATAVGLLGGVLVGALVGALTAVALGPRVGAAVGVTVGLIAWPALTAITVARQGIDVEGLKARFYPEASIETAKETIAWVRERMPLGPKS
ncbi:MAG: phage holin family protein [Chloroflexi bacterium]|nr:phage holin family protein [Chloroflexota bacterium]